MRDETELTLTHRMQSLARDGRGSDEERRVGEMRLAQCTREEKGCKDGVVMTRGQVKLALQKR
eukprot:6204354-Pleurochrysis_carterae.AAC.5